MEKIYAKGDKIYVGECEYAPEFIGCPDCLGTLKWTVVFADGEALEIECQTCKRGYEPSTGKIEVHKNKPVVRHLTIGSVRFNDADKYPYSYMCEETGVGSGRIYYEDSVFDNYEDALVYAKKQHETRMIELAQNNFSKKFGGTKFIENSLSTMGFTRRQQLEKVAQFKQWAKLSKIIK